MEIEKPFTRTFDMVVTPVVPGSLWAHPRVEHRPHFGLALEAGPVLAVQIHELGGDPDRFGLRFGVQNCPAADDFFALREWAVAHGDLAVREPNTDPVLARK